MSQISLKSISGITSITTPAGVDNQFTLHTNNTSQAFKLDLAGNIHINNHINITGISSASNFKTGSPNLHSSGLSVASIDVGNNIKVGNAGITQLNFIGAGNTFAVSGTTVDISIAGGGGGGSGAFTTSITGIQTTSQIVGIGTTSTDDADLQGIGNSARGMYVSNGMIIMDNLVSGNHYIGTNFSGMMAGPVSITGVLSIDGNYVVV